MNINFYLRLIVFTLLGLVNAQWAAAQNVTIRPSNGSMIASVPENISGTDDDYDTFFKRGGFATWRHNQLCLTMTTSDSKELTDNFQLKNPANNLYGRTSTNEIEMGRGASEATQNCYMNFALPKGYRFTGYEIVFSRKRADFGNNDNSYYNSSNNPYTAGTTIFGETNINFEYLDGYYKTVTYNADATLENGSVTIKKEDETGMGNILYFKLTDDNTGKGRMVITFHSITLYFTPEEDYTPILPQSSIGVPVSAVDIPFETGKVDYGSIESRRYNGVDRVSYSSANVIDMKANMTLYEAGSLENGTNFDGTSGQVVKYQKGNNFTIRNYNDFFVLGKSGAEQVYYLETPTYVTLPDENETKNPVGFRIVGAELEYEYGTAIPARQITEPHNYITYTSGGTTYYLDNTGHFVTGTKTEWEIDDDGYVHSGNVYLLCESRNNSYYLALGTSKDNNKVYTYTYYGNVYLFSYVGYNNFQFLKGTTSPTDTPVFNTSSSNYAFFTTETTTTTVPAFTPAPFKLHVYKKDGTLLETREINSSDDNGKVTLTGFNNDAIKFGVEGIGFVKGVLTMQALDPYIDRMSVVCQDQTQTAIRMTQTFTASDFSVNGGEFYFYLPSDCINHNVKISYEDLWSHYADETYEGGSSEHNSRFSFVKSAHYNKYTSDNIYNDVDEAKADKNTVSERQIVDLVGSARFKFNNADAMQTTGGTLTEYPFTQANYAADPNNGRFSTMTFTVSASDQNETAYVFTTDETRYNIAPTTALQHRAYAFYEMVVHVQSATYTPKVKIEKVYANSCTENNGAAEDKPYYKAIVTAPFGNPVQKGFASDKQIEDAIDNVITNKKDDFSNTDVPASAKQILSVDLSGLAGYYTNSQASMTLNKYKNTKLGENALVFMPKGVTTSDDNFAYMTEGGNFRAANNIILTDKKPFYSPYDIQVPSNNYATYKRLRTASTEGLVKKATVVLPFTMKVTGGKHKNDTEDGFEFNLRELKKLTEQTGTTDQYGNGNFELIGGEETEANRPYMVEVISANGSDYSFIAAQKGSNIIATPGTTFTGETAGGLTNTGTYSGVTLSTENKFYYFTRDKYVLSETAKGKYTEIYVQPFRAYYVGSSAGSKLSMFEIVYDELDENDGLITGITDVRTRGPLSVVTGHGNMMLTSTEDINVTVCNIKGTVVANLKMTAGEQQNINVPAGVYLVNKNKVIVK